jgi:hypothetical protein
MFAREPGGSFSAEDLVKNFLDRPQKMTALHDWIKKICRGCFQLIGEESIAPGEPRSFAKKLKQFRVRCRILTSKRDPRKGDV